MLYMFELFFGLWCLSSQAYAQGETISDTFFADSLTSTFGQVVNIRSDVITDTTNNRWIINGADEEPVEMGLRTIIRGGNDCVATNFNIYYDIGSTSSESDGGIILSVGSEYISFIFDFDGNVLIDGNTLTGGVGIYPGCGSNILPLIPNNGIDSGALFADNQDTNPNDNTPFYNWRDRMAGGTRNNWQSFNSAKVNKQNSFDISFNIPDPTSNRMIVSFNADSYSATCEMNTQFSFVNGNDIYVDFSPDFSTENWQINSITASTDCSPVTLNPTPRPTGFPTPKHQIQQNLQQTDQLIHQLYHLLEKMKCKKLQYN